MDLKTRELLNDLTAIARTNLEKHGELAPVCILINHDTGHSETCALRMENDMMKTISAMALKGLANAMQADFSFFASEAWIVKASAGSTEDGTQYPDGIRPSEHPNRQEVVNFMVETKDCYYQAYCEIDRATGRPTFHEPEWKRKDRDHVKGKFTGILAAT